MKRYLQLITVLLALVLFPLVSANAKDKVRIGGDIVVEKGTQVKDAVVIVGFGGVLATLFTPRKRTQVEIAL